VESGGAGRITMWMLDTNYDGMSVEPEQVFFPMGGKDDGWGKLAKTLKAEINQDLIEEYAGIKSLPFTVKNNAMVAVKIIDDRGIESMKIFKIREKGDR
jgi:adenine-specific DNA-methyltransferase